MPMIIASTNSPARAVPAKNTKEFFPPRNNLSQFAESADHAASEIIKLGSAAAAKIVQNAARQVDRIDTDLPLNELLERIDDILRSMQPELRGVLANAATAAAITGTVDVHKRLPTDIVRRGDRAPPNDLTVDLLQPDPSGVRFPILDRAEETIRQSPLFAGEHFLHTARAVQRGAFGVTGDLTEQAVADVRDVLAENIAGGLDRKKFINTVRERLCEGSPLSEAHLDTIFRANVQSQLSRAMNDSLSHWLVRDRFPYRKYLFTMDSRVRPDHKIMGTSGGLDGTGIYNASDPVWKMLMPPFAFGCRCTFVPLTVEQAARYGVREAIDWLDRAKALSAANGGGDFGYYLAGTVPDVFEMVEWPTYDGERIMPAPGFEREP